MIVVYSNCKNSQIQGYAYMQVRPVNSEYSLNKNSFQGSVDKSVYKYVKNAKLHCEDSEKAEALSSYIIHTIEQFMQPLHEDTVFSIVEDLHAKEVRLPFSEPHIQYTFVSVGDYQSLFSNKKIKSEFSMSRKFERIRDNNSGQYYDVQKDFLGMPNSTGALERLKSHVDNIVEFFNNHNKDFNVDSILYNQRLRCLKYFRTLTPNFIKKMQYKNTEKLKTDFYTEPFNKDVYVEKVYI